MTDLDKDIADVDKAHRDANIRAMRTTGFKRRVYLLFASFFGWAGDLGREIQQEEQRGKDDSYHEEY